MNWPLSSFALLVVPAFFACKETSHPNRDSNSELIESPAEVESARGTLVWEPEGEAPLPAAPASPEGLGYSGASAQGEPGIARSIGNPLLSNVIFEVQGPLNGPNLGFLGNQYYLSSTVEFTGGRITSPSNWRQRNRAVPLHLETEASKVSQPSVPQTWKPSTSAVNATRLSVGDDDELRLLGVEANVWVDGFRARVLMDCVYENDRDQQLEGKFSLRLPEGAKPYYLAFGKERVELGDAWKLSDRSTATGPDSASILSDREEHWLGAREARFVPRKKAARAYKNTVRRRVDPALMEWAGAGVFNARVFPLEPNTVHRVVVGYEVDLVQLPQAVGDYEFRLSMPTDLPALSMDLHVLAPQRSKVAITPGVPARFDELRRSYHFGQTDAREFRVELPGLRETAIVSAEDSGYFAMDITPELDSVPTEGSPAAVFLVDTSLSSAGGRFPIWIDLMDSILEKNSSSLREFAVLFFDVTPRWWRPEATANTEAARRELRSFVVSLALEGASDLGSALKEATEPGWLDRGWGSECDFFLLSDGDATWGEHDTQSLIASTRRGTSGAVFAYTTGLAGTSVGNLRQLTRESGGALFSVNGPAAIESASVAHLSLPWRIEEVRVEGGSDLLLRGLPAAVYSGQSLRVVGRGVPPIGSELELLLERDGVRKTESFPMNRTLETALASRAYGMVATAQLEELGTNLQKIAEAYAIHFRVPGKSCSLLMLESDDDYAEQGVLPPEDVLQTSALWPTADVESARKSGRRSLTDPVNQLLDQLASLAELKLIDAFDEELSAELHKLPPESLTISPSPLTFEALLASSVPEAVASALAAGQPDYQLVRSEAARRARELALGDAVRMSSSLVELNPGDAIFARDVAQTLMQWGLFGHAYHLHARVAELRPFEPDSYLSLGRCAAEAGKPELAMIWYTVAIRGEWTSSFGEIRRVAAFEALNLMRQRQSDGQSTISIAAEQPSIEELVTLVGFAQADLAVVIQWNTDRTDIDLHVREPGGSHCYYGNSVTRKGGRLSQDVTTGFGPELYFMKRAPAGTYDMSVTYFSGNAVRSNVQTRVLATVYQDWGKPEQVTARRQIELDSVSESKRIARLTLKPTLVSAAD